MAPDPSLFDFLRALVMNLVMLDGDLAVWLFLVAVLILMLCSGYGLVLAAEGAVAWWIVRDRRC